MRHTIGIEPDENASLTLEASYRVVIRRKDGTVVGIPLCAVSEATAREMLQPLRPAFLVGVNSSKWVTSRACDHIVLNDAPPVEVGILKPKTEKPTG